MVQRGSQNNYDHTHDRTISHALPAMQEALELPALLQSSNVFDPASEDEPKGVWALQYNAGKGQVW